MDDLISRSKAIKALEKIDLYKNDCIGKLGVLKSILALERLPSAQPDLSEYSDKLWRAAYERGKKEAQTDISEDGTLTVTVPKGTNVNRVLVQEDGTTYGSLFYRDSQPDIVRCRDCFKREICRTTRIWAVAPSDDWFCADGERLPLPEPLRGEKHETD